MNLKFSLVLPREAMGVPMIRRVLGDALRGLGVSDECVADIIVAASEACTNAVQHAESAPHYQLVVGVDGAHCVLKVVDRGTGLRAEPDDAGHPDAESGRGIMIMRSLVDEVSFEGDPTHGTVVYLQKRLIWSAEAPFPQVDRELLRAAG